MGPAEQANWCGTEGRHDSEQMLYDRYPGAWAESGGFDKIRGISPTNPNLDFYMQSAQDFLDRMGPG